MQTQVRRYLPEEPLPPYTFVAGRFPHPTRDPDGHSFRRVLCQERCPDPNKWDDCRSYLRGIDLFNHGYYWEAHEAWESLWHACGRSGIAGEFLRGLIRLAAAGVKAREGRPEGVRRHAEAAEELLRKVAAELASSQSRFMGIHLDELCRFAAELAAGQRIRTVSANAPVGIVFDFVLQPA